MALFFLFFFFSGIFLKDLERCRGIKRVVSFGPSGGKSSEFIIRAGHVSCFVLNAYKSTQLAGLPVQEKGVASKKE